MNYKEHFKNSISKIKISLFCLISVNTSSLAQEYRDARAYISDFSRNEVYVSTAMMEYSKSVVNLSPDDRKEVTVERLYQKLENINTILLNTDKGFKNDFTLRNAFINLNNSVIFYLKNDLLSLKDYREKSLLDYDEIQKKFTIKEKDINLFFAELKSYDSIKKSFATKLKVKIKPYNFKNIFEYNANQNFIFYKINVLDEKLVNAIDNLDPIQINIALQKLTEECNNSLLKTTQYKDIFDDNSLNDANINAIRFFVDQKNELIPLAIEFSVYKTNFKNLKDSINQNSIEIEEYNSKVREFNSIKNKFYTLYQKTQMEKNILINNWLITNSKFLINNTEFENVNNRFVDND